MSDARWLEIDNAVAGAVRHFAGATEIFDQFGQADRKSDRYRLEMGFMHAMQAAHTSLESALLRILEMWEEPPPTGPRWHAALIRRVSQAVEDRPAILTGEVAAAAEETRHFRNLAARSCDTFDYPRAEPALAAARLLAADLSASIARFRQAIDP
jgi:hypothetical protein